MRAFWYKEKKIRIGRYVAHADDVMPGILGNDVLRHFVVTIDYDGEFLHLTEPAP
jgi:hypothetical protein